MRALARRAEAFCAEKLHLRRDEQLVGRRYDRRARTSGAGQLGYLAHSCLDLIRHGAQDLAHRGGTDNGVLPAAGVVAVRPHGIAEGIDLVHLQRERRSPGAVGVGIVILSDDVDLILRIADIHRLLVANNPRIRDAVGLTCLDDFRPGVIREICLVLCSCSTLAEFNCRYEERLCRHSVRTRDHGCSITIWKFDLLHCAFFFRAKSGKERIVQVGVQAAVRVVVCVRSIPCAVLIEVFHQQPRSVAAGVIQ